MKELRDYQIKNANECTEILNKYGIVYLQHTQRTGKTLTALQIAENIKSKKFTIPSVQEVQNYCNERKNGISAFKFVNFYQTKDWMIGKNKMKDWKSAVHTWETPKNENKNGNTKNTTPTKINGKTRQFTIDEFATPSGDSTE